MTPGSAAREGSPIMEPDRYAVAVKRERRSDVPLDWQQQLAACAGAEILGQSAGRVVASLSPAALAEVRQQLGSWLHVEPLVPHGIRPPGVRREA
jgi:hypothetical protein